MRTGVSFIIFVTCAIRRLRRDCSGASALEFALIVPWFLICLIGILEIAFVFFAGQLLETATQDASRLIMTGQAKSTTLSKEKFHELVCGKVNVMFDCSNLHVDAQAYTSFPEPDFTKSVVEDKRFSLETQFNTGQQGSIVVVRTFYELPVFLTGFFGYDRSNLEGGKLLLSASAAVRNEPW